MIGAAEPFGPAASDAWQRRTSTAGDIGVSKPVRPRRDFSAMEARRMHAADLLEEGRLNKAEIARELGVAHQTVSDWDELYRTGGRDALRAAGRAGRLPKLDAAGLELIEAQLLKGAKAHGYPNDLWKSARHRGAVIVFEDESGCSLLPSVRATWAPKGKTPVLSHRFSWKRLSMAGALVYEPDGSDAELVFGMRPGAYNDCSLIEFLTELHHLVGGRQMTLIWDGLPSHRSKAMTSWIAEQRSWLRVERLAGYAHELNPVEGVWGNVKGKELANLCPDTVDEMEQAVDDGLCRIGSDRELCLAFLNQTPLRL